MTTGWQGTVGFRSFRTCQDRPDNDHGSRHQGRRQQVRHARPQLHGPRRQARPHPARRPGDNIIKNGRILCYCCSGQCFVPGRTSRPSLIFQSKARSLP
jgi:hypothetical protein